MKSVCVFQDDGGCTDGGQAEMSARKHKAIGGCSSTGERLARTQT